MLLNHLYTILESEQIENKHLFEVELNAAHPIFDGHFPDVPVLPGVTMMQMLKELLEFSLKQPLQIQKMGNMKFLQMINPQEVALLRVEIEITEEDGDDLKIKAQIFDKEKVCFKALGQLAILK